MANVFARKCLRIVVAALCQTIGWRKIKPTSMEVLIDLLEHYIKSLGKGAHEYAEQRGSTVPVLEDLALALSDAGVTIPPLEEYIHEVGQVPWPENSGTTSSGAVPVFPVQVPSRRNGVEQHLQFFDSWAESEDECCSHLVPPTQHTDSNVGVYPSEVSVDVAGGSCKAEDISRSTDNIPQASQASVVAMTECGILSASRDGRQPSARRPTTPPRYSPSPDRQRALSGFHTKKEKKKIKGKENTGVSKTKIKTVLGMGKVRPPPECSSGQSIDSAFTSRFCDKTQPFNSQKYINSKGNPLNSMTSKDILQHSHHVDKKSLTLASAKERNPKPLQLPGAKHISTDNKLAFKHNMQPVPGATSYKDSSDFGPDTTVNNLLPQCKKLGDKPKSEPLESSQWSDVPIKKEPMDVNPVTGDQTSSTLNSNNLMPQKSQIKTEITINNKEGKSSLDDGSLTCTPKEIAKPLLLIDPQSVKTVDKSEPINHQRNSPKCVGGNSAETQSTVDPIENKQPKITKVTDTAVTPSSTYKSNSLATVVDMNINERNKPVSKERTSHLPVPADKLREKQDKKTETATPSKNLLNSSTKSSTKEACTSNKGNLSSKKVKHAGSFSKLPQKTGSQWDTTLDNLFAPDIVQKKKKCDIVKDKDHKSNTTKGTDLIRAQKVPPVTNEVQKLHSDKGISQPPVVNKVVGNDTTKPNKTSKVMTPANTDIKGKEKECVSSKRTSSVTTEESLSKHSHKRVKEEIPSSTNMPTWRVRAALIYSSSSDSEIDVVKPAKALFGTPSAVRITETPKTPRTPDVPTGISVHSRCKKVISDAQEVQLGLDLGTPPPARPPTPGKVTPPVVEIGREKHKHKKKKKKHEKKHSPKKEKVQLDGDKVHSKSDLVAAEGLMQLTSFSGDKRSGDLSHKETVSGAKRKHKHSALTEHSKKRHGLSASLPVAPSSPVVIPSVSQQPSLPKVQVPVNGLPVTISDDGPVGFYFDESGNRVWVCPSCGGQDDGSPMIRCDDCYAWYHWACVGIDSAPDENVDWFCSYCFSKNDRQMKKHKSSSVHRKKSHSKSSKK
ncbi:transcription initiation factor TFIID subunit 3-like [Schistocerca cancellata]|uniref:transcription initiation factor TFIID subunit 3-like n=1 Tax=Schistocerca cancellata TaxID=274614 RepID=UPI0021178065|nr:transcription initiation factor TFIID subunit 3-like [Schistocerca cancellata]XP_049773450.1 transcription initiation factor TFIID subunit 3-like [Schistocerca cancellata]XP_049773451.1 transcription initiation factor TFIID subunit 3-like [Schistocerca cancellata]